jgi:hypothetical protein
MSAVSVAIVGTPQARPLDLSGLRLALTVCLFASRYDETCTEFIGAGMRRLNVMAQYSAAPWLAEVETFRA